MNVRDLDPYLIFYGKFPIVTDVKNPAQWSSYECVLFLLLSLWNYFYSRFRIFFFTLKEKMFSLGPDQPVIKSWLIQLGTVIKIWTAWPCSFGEPLVLPRESIINT